MPSSTISPKEVVQKCRVVAVVGASKNPEKEAFTVPAYLKEHGFEIIPINPTAEEVNGAKAYPSLAALPAELAKSVEVVEVFRPSAELPQVAQQVIEMKQKTGRPLVFWAQTGLENEEAKATLSGSKVDYVMDACMRVVHQLYGKRA